ncbi:MAG: ABC transporter transmembrane domain-containing protein, partial [Pseudobdellovibrionaceae bacterium]
MNLFSVFRKNPYVAANLKAEKGQLVRMGVVLFSQAVLALLMPLPIRFVLDKLLVPGQAETGQPIDLLVGGGFEGAPIPLLVWMTFLMLLLTGATAILDFLEEIYTSKAIAGLTTRVRGDLFQKLLTRKQSYIDSKRKIDLMGRLSGDVANLEIPIASGMISLVRAAPTVLLIVGAILWVNWQFAIFVLIVLPTLYFLATWLSKKIRAQEKIMRSKTVIMDQDMHQALSAMSLIKSLTGEKEAFGQISKRQNEVAQAFRNSRRAYAYFNSSLTGARNIVRALFVLFGGMAVLSGHVTIGTLFLFVSYLEALNRPINDISTLISRLSKALVSIERVEGLHQELQGYPEESGRLPLERSRGILQFENVSFAYAGSDPIFDNLSLNFSPGQFLAIVGPSGVGKTSFLKLLN